MSLLLRIDRANQAAGRLRPLRAAFLIVGTTLTLVLHLEPPWESQPGIPATARLAAKPPSTAGRLPSGNEGGAGRVAATVDGQPIHAEDVRRHLAGALRGREVEGRVRPALEARALEQLIDRELILRYLDRYSLGATPAQVELAVARLEKRLRQRGGTLAEHLEANGWSESQLRRDLAWEIGWQRYLDRYLTEENLRNYFDRHRPRFDGRRVRVAHILFAVKPASPPVAAGDAGANGATSGEAARRAALEQAVRRAGRVRAEILAGQSTFAEAARRHSDSPSGREGGGLGWIERDRPMPEPFSAAAFELKPQEVSPPVLSPLGVHLIQCRQIAAGDKSWNDVEEALRAAMTRYLFDWTASRQRPRSAIHFSGSVPYVNPTSGQVVADGTPWTPGAALEGGPGPAGENRDGRP